MCSQSSNLDSSSQAILCDAGNVTMAVVTVCVLLCRELLGVETAGGDVVNTLRLDLEVRFNVGNRI